MPPVLPPFASRRPLLRSTLLLAAIAAFVPSTAVAAPDWVGDFETGDLSQWWLSNQVIGNAANMTVTEDVVYEGQYAGRIQLDAADHSPSGHNRNELVYAPDYGTFEGSERWYSITMQPGEAWASSWHLVFYWEGNPVYASVMSMVVANQQMQFHTMLPTDTQRWAGAWQPGVWQQLILHVNWSPDPAVGFVELYLDGDQVLPLTYVATMHGPGVVNELHAGILRDDNIEMTEVLYLDAVRDGATMEDVMTEPNAGTGGADDTSGGGNDETGGSEGGGPPPGTTSGAGSESGNVESSAGSGDASGGADGATDGGGASDGGEGGCGCRSTAGSTSPGLLALLALGLGLRRRRGPGLATIRD